MALAPYINAQRGDRAFIRGQFREVDQKNLFEWFDRNTLDRESFAAEFPHRIYVGPGMDGEGDTRVARVLKTRVHVVVDEAADGSPVVETWHIRARKIYGRAV